MTSTTTVNRVQSLSALEVKSAMDRGEIMLIDVREPSEFAAERIPGAALMPLSRFDPSVLPIHGAPNTVVLHCQAGSRSAKAAKRLLDAGHDMANELAGGIEAWKRAGLPIVRDANAPISILRQVQITSGSLVLIGILLGILLSPWFFGLSGFIGAGLVFAGVTDTCGMAMVLAKMPWNRGQLS